MSKLTIEELKTAKDALNAGSRGPLAIGQPARSASPGLAGLHSARRGAYRVVYVIDADQRTVVVPRIDHRSRVY